MSVTANIDLSASWGPTLVQGARSTCLAFAASELNRDLNRTGFLLSAEYIYRAAARMSALWHPGAGLHLSDVSAALSHNGQPADEHCFYLADEPTENPPDLPALPALANLYKGRVQIISPTPQNVEAELLQRTPVGLILKLTQTFLKPDLGIIDFSHMLLTVGMHHAVVATGCGTCNDTGELHFRIRNTWGQTWGDQGCAWIPRSYVQSHAVTAFKVN